MTSAPFRSASGPGQPDEPTTRAGRARGPPSGPRIEASVGDVHLTPGQTGIVPVLIRNIEYVARNYSLAVVGVDPEWVVVPAWFGPLAPGASATIEIRISLPSGFPACDYTAALHIQPGDPATGAAAGPTITVNLPADHR